MRTIWESGKYRITEQYDTDYDLDDLKGDMYNPDENTDISPTELLIQEKHFERKVGLEGVFGYVLEEWNPDIGQGWEHKDSCWGFIGAYYDEESHGHGFIEELKDSIKGEL